MADARRWLALDAGTTAVKAALIDGGGRVLASAEEGIETLSAEGGVVEQRPDDWWRAAVAAVGRLDARAVEGVALTGQMQDLVLLDEGAAPLRPALLYSDTRATREAAEVDAELGAAELLASTGNEQGPAGLLAKLRWLARHEPDTLAAARTLLLGSAELLVLRLGGRAASDTTTASTTGLMALEGRRWLDAELLERAAGAPVARLLPELVPGGAAVGRVDAKAAEALGIEEGLSIYLGPGDAAATTLGVGGGAPGRPYAYLGTSGWVAFTASERGDASRGVFTLAHPDPALVVGVAPLLTAGGNLDWIVDVTGAGDLGAAIAGALALPPTELLYLPYLRGERSPIRDERARGAFVGLDAGHGRGELTRAVLQGVAYAYRHALEALVGGGVERLALTGGGTRSSALVQLFADAIGVEVEVPAGALHAGVLGALIAAGALPADFVPPPVATHRPDPERRAFHDGDYRRFRQIYPALKGIFVR